MPFLARNMERQHTAIAVVRPVPRLRCAGPSDLVKRVCHHRTLGYAGGTGSGSVLRRLVRVPHRWHHALFAVFVPHSEDCT